MPAGYYYARNQFAASYTNKAIELELLRRNHKTNFFLD